MPKKKSKIMYACPDWYKYEDFDAVKKKCKDWKSGESCRIPGCRGGVTVRIEEVQDEQA